MKKLFALTFVLALNAHAQVNSWTNASPGNWAIRSSWSAGLPTNSQSCFITNAFSKTVTVNAATVASNAVNGCMTVSNLTVNAPASPASANTLSLINAGLATNLHIQNTLNIGERGSLGITNSVLYVRGLVYNDGNVVLNTGAIIATNVGSSIGPTAAGQMTVFDGTWRAASVTVSVFAGSKGVLTLAGGTNHINDSMFIGELAGSTGAVWVTGGELVVSSGVVRVGYGGDGQLTVSNGTVSATNVTIATLTGSVGSLTVAGGTFTVNQLIATNLSIVHFPGGNTTLRGAQVGTSQLISIGADGRTALLNLTLTGTNRFGEFAAASSVGSTGIVTLSGGVLLSTNDLFSTRIGSSGVGQMTITNSTFVVDRLVVGYNNGAQGTLSFTAGSSVQTRLLNMGLDFNATGTVWITGGGQLIVTNGLTVLGDHGSGRLILSNGTWQANRVSVGHSIGGAGTLTVAGGTSVIASNLVVGLGATTTGTVWVTGGQLLSTNSIGGNDTIIASNGTGQATISNGLVRTYTQIIGAGSAGTLTMAGGTNHVGGDFVVGKLAGATGTVWLTGGQLEVNDGFDPLVILGDAGVGRMTVSNGTWLSRYVNVGGTVGGSGTLTIAGGTNIVNALLGLGMSSGATGVVWMTGGELTTTNGPARVGHVSVAQMTVSNGTWRARNVDVGAFSGGRGTLTLAGGNNRFSSLTAGLFPGATGTVAVTGIQLILTNAPTTIGSNGVGQLTISNATVQTSTLVIGHGFGSAGTVTLNGGTLITDKLVLTNLNSRLAFNSGTLETKSTVATNLDGIVIGNGTNAATLRLVGGTHSCFDDGAGNLVVFSNAVLTGTGTISLSFVHNFGVIAPGDSIGRFDINGSLRLTNSSNMRIELGGYTPGTTHDLITVTNTTTLRGKLSLSFINDFASTVTNGASFTVLVGHAPIAGTFANVASGGLLATTDGFANFIVTYSGTNIVLTSLGVLDSDLDGMPNWWEQKYFGSLTGAAPGDDADGDGLTNLQEFQSGTDPTNSASVFRITATTREGVDVRVTWNCVSNYVYMVQTNSPPSSGSYTNNFSDLSPLIFVTSGMTSTNYLHSGGVTNRPALFYRVRLVTPP